MTKRESTRKALNVIVAAFGTVLLISLCYVFVSPIHDCVAFATFFATGSCRMKVWVKVIDQYGDPVRGYSLSIQGLQSSLLPFGGNRWLNSTRTSDHQGLVFYDAEEKITGACFGSFLHENGTNPVYLPSMENVTISCAEVAGSVHSKKSEMGLDREHPILVSVYKHGPPQRLLRCEIRDYNLKPGESYLSIDIFRGSMFVSQRPEGDIAFRAVIDDAGAVSGVSIVAAKSAGLRQMEDHYRVTPPESGYRAELLFPRDMKETTIECGSYVAYFYCRDRRYFGCIQFDFPHHFLYFVNINGQRNLYYDGYPNTDSSAMKDYITPPIEVSKEH